MQNSEFFDILSSNYDEMIDFENSLKSKRENLKEFSQSYYKTAFDLGCGSGADSIALTKLGLKVDAVDHSKGMLEQARKNANTYNSIINFIQSNTSDLGINQRYDFIVSLGNTVSNISEGELRKLFAKLSNSLTTNGSILIQVINYAKLPKAGQYILNEFNSDTNSITRKYYIHSDYIDFIIEKVDKLTNQKDEIATKLYPYSVNEFKELAHRYGFNLEFYGDLKKEIYQPEQSNNLVVLFRKQK